MSPIDYDELPTERSAPDEPHLDTLGVLELVDRIHAQDQIALAAVGRARREIAATIEAAARALNGGGRLIYVGAGTSGRLATLDAAECPPTFGTPAAQVQCVMAGGSRALRRSVEGAEDSREEGRHAVRRLRPDERDLLCGVSASGVTPFVRAALAEGRRRHATTALITCAPRQLVQAAADLLVCLEVGPETVAGSTRMKAGLVTKAVLHTLSTATMIRLGKVYGDAMIEVRPLSRKLRHRAAAIVARLTGLPPPQATRLLERAGGSPKVAAVMHHLGLERPAARRLLRAHAGRLREIIGDH